MAQAHGKMIGFHKDRSQRVMQVALNSDEEYQGGRLVFVSQGKFEVPKRPAGTITIHSKDIVHAVTKLISGIRYGLFYIKH
jgi:predicted 2-oxoglutarate/Fe(II)-dependent dioxygenase YbiX